jgi:hypothetical protein
MLTELKGGYKFSLYIILKRRSDMDNIDVKPIPKQFEERLSWLLYDLMSENCSGTYYYDGGQMGEVTIKIKQQG